jgi:hypothetical protein
MGKCWTIALAVLFLIGCDSRTARMEHPENPQGRYREQISAAKRVLQQEEQWADRAEWEVNKNGDGWQVVAWRVERPDRKGPDRYLPWGYSIIELDSRMVPVLYRRKG